MKRIIIILIVLFCSYQVSEGQLWKLRKFEANAGIGTTQFFGDIGGYSPTENILGIKDLSINQTRMDLSTSLRYRIMIDVAVRFNLGFGYLHATDKRGSNELRGYDAVTYIFEPSFIGEYYFIKNDAENSYIFIKGRGKMFETLIKSLDFYVMGGIGGLSYNVKGNDALVARGLKNKGFTMTFPIGVGTSFVYSPDFNFGFELGYRYAATDYLDGYTSQYSKSNDVYYFLNVTVTYKMKTGKNGLPSFRQ